MAAPIGESTQLVRIGIVGGGFMARTHTLAYDTAQILYPRELPAIELRRLADITPELASTAARDLGWADATGDWREITRAPDIDLVDIVTPNNVHAEVAIDAACHGKHVLCEKPLAHTLEAANEMYHAVRDAGVTHQVGFVFRKWPAMKLARRLVDEGRIGRILQCRIWYFHDYALDADFPTNWRWQRDIAGAGCIGDLGSHVFDLGRYLVSDLTRVLARSRTMYPRRPRAAVGQLYDVDVDDATDVLVEFENGASGLIQVNWMATGYKTDIGFELLGDRGAIQFSWQRNVELRLYTHDGSEDLRGFRTIVLGPMHPGADGFWPVSGQGLGYGDAFVIQTRDLLRGLSGDEPVTPTFLDGLRAAELVDAAVRSAESETWIEVERTAP